MQIGNADLEHCLRSDKLTAELAGVTRLNDGNPTVKAIIAAVLVRVNQHSYINDRNKIKVGEAVQEVAA